MKKYIDFIHDWFNLSCHFFHQMILFFTWLIKVHMSLLPHDSFIFKWFSPWFIYFIFVYTWIIYLHPPPPIPPTWLNFFHMFIFHVHFSHVVLFIPYYWHDVQFQGITSFHMLCDVCNHILLTWTHIRKLQYDSI